MRGQASRGLAAGLALLAGGLALGAWMAKEPVAAAPKAVCGVALGLFASDPSWDYGPMLDEIAAHGATDALLSVPWVQDDVHAATLAPQPGQSPSDDALRRTIAQAQDRGLRVSLMPVVRLRTRAPGAWRGALDPADRDAWFAAYGALLLDHARLAEALGVTRLVVGSELTSLEGDVERWEALVGDVRAETGATLTWSANWDAFDRSPLWPLLDEVGVSAWFAPADGWAAPRRRLSAVKAATGKPVLFTEVGYPARATAAERPWDHAGSAPLDLGLQASLVRSLFREFADDNVVDGMFVWNWFGEGGASAADYTPRGRPAAGVIKRRFADWCPPEPPVR